MIKKLNSLILLAFLSISAITVESLQKPDGPIADYANIIDDHAERQIYSITQQLWEKARFGLIVVTLPEIGDESIEDFSARLYEKWGIGSSKMDEGALMLVTMNPKRVRIETGYGTEGYINDAKAGRILDKYAIPFFKNGQFSEGIRSTVMAIGAIIENNGQEIDQPAEKNTEIPQRISFFHVILFLIAAIFLLGTPFGRTLLIALILSSGRSGGSAGGGGFGGGLGGGGFGGGFGGGRSGGGGASRSF